MHRFRLAAAALLGAALSSACYRVTVTTGAAPTATVVDRAWSNSFIVGLVPPPPLSVAQQCSGGSVSKVVTQQSFLNGLAAALTGSLYTPMQVTVTCGSARSSSLGLPPDVLGAPTTRTDAPR